MVFLFDRQAVHNSLVGRKKDALKKITSAIETDPAVAEYHILRLASSIITGTSPRRRSVLLCHFNFDQ